MFALYMILLTFEYKQHERWLHLLACHLHINTRNKSFTVSPVIKIYQLYCEDEAKQMVKGEDEKHQV